MAYNSNGCNKVEEFPKVGGNYVQCKSGNIFDMMQDKNVTTDHSLNISAKTISFYRATLCLRGICCRRVSVCLPVCLSQASIVSNDWTNRDGFFLARWLPSTYPTLSYKKI